MSDGDHRPAREVTIGQARRAAPPDYSPVPRAVNDGVMIFVLWVLLFSVLLLRPALEPGLGRDAVTGILFGSTLGLSLYASAPWGAPEPGTLPALTIGVAAAGVATGWVVKPLLEADNI
jgi:hypothetical protein